MICTEGNEQAHSIAEAVARRSYGKLVAFLAARTRDVAAAEDALSEAFAAALAGWPLNGCPANPEAWLLTVARRKAIDAHRTRRLEVPAADLFPDDPTLAETLASDSSPIPEIPDLRLALMFVCAHPAIDPAIRAPLILQSVLGLDAARIASAFLTSPSAMGKRLVRAKEKIRHAAIPFEIPGREVIPARLEAVLDAIYAAFTEGWPDPAAADSVRRDLTAEALFLARLLHSLLPAEPEAASLLALMLYVDSRRAARRSPSGDYVPLARQDTALWDSKKIAEAEDLLHRSSGLQHIGRYQLEAALQSAHLTRRLTGKNNWEAVVQLYDVLLALTHSPVVAINRALAIAETQGPAAALESMEYLTEDPRLAQYQPWWAARADLLARAGDCPQAYRAYEIAIGLESDPAVRRFLQLRQSALPHPPGSF
jgi:RNA polymerase sigma-70 factor (ECF subfamily)